MPLGMTPGQRLPRIASIATMPSRIEGFEKVVAAISPQVDHMFVYLDGFADVPAFLRHHRNITVRRAEKLGNLHASSRFLCLQELRQPSPVFTIDDDIAYPPDYIAVLSGLIEKVQGKALIGLHGRIYLPPHRSYVTDAMCVHFAGEQKQARHVHELGCGTLGFLSTSLPIDPRNWPRTDMDDIFIAIEAQKLGLPRISIPRPQGWLKPYAENQEDSLWVRTQKDDRAQSEAMRTLLRLYSEPTKISAKPSIQSREHLKVPMPG